MSQVAASLATMTVCIEADVTDQAALDRAARQVEERLGAAGVVVADAGIAVGGPFSRTDAELRRRVADVNLVGAANTARAFLPQLTFVVGRITRHGLREGSTDELGADVEALGADGRADWTSVRPET
ncbi:SDR family NAD(P)-dependent oxidoreductase [Streptomyces sp. NPDC046197]|uniref:SDR family NAD(P)-dependent oxidoreductase n=1 Tax=Streptomyces sp. NPDC046197 TaxID=3154337 RepID=UPI0033E51199